MRSRKGSGVRGLDTTPQTPGAAAPWTIQRKRAISGKGVGFFEAASMPLSMERMVMKLVPLAEEGGRKAAHGSAMNDWGTLFRGAASEITEQSPAGDREADAGAVPLPPHPSIFGLATPRKD